MSSSSLQILFLALFEKCKRELLSHYLKKKIFSSKAVVEITKDMYLQSITKEEENKRHSLCMENVVTCLRLSRPSFHLCLIVVSQETKGPSSHNPL